MSAVLPSLGVYLLTDFVNSTALYDPAPAEEALTSAAIAAKAHVLDVETHDFGQRAWFTGVALLAESHISIHTWPEHGYTAIDIFMCGDAEPQRIDVHSIKQGLIERNLPRLAVKGRMSDLCRCPATISLILCAICIYVLFGPVRYSGHVQSLPVHLLIVIRHDNLSHLTINCPMIFIGGFQTELRLASMGAEGLVVLSVVAGTVAEFALTGRITAFAQGHLYFDRIVWRKQSQYQSLVVTNTWQKNDLRLYIDGHLQFAEADEYRYREALVHPILSWGETRPSPFWFWAEVTGWQRERS
ncbi:adenosylmethionine decarboxylase [Ruegeria atlantica]|uniref:S-adenosylmethionine decarboxylase proenzyme n=1 Tax=Ruegeria atlantica TaxID=81569 RepID=A0A0P1EQB4_9RHOB|nr:adenosylmethionine decarboxylase [Ruegeria atlantica]CUH44658.1 S-adenosylmethionine decarboxylase proenzyme precursor [Ruegeria atlantica]